MTELPKADKLQSILDAREESAGLPREPIALQNDIALLDPDPIAKGAFGQVYTGRILNPIALLAERVIWGEENPRWLGLESPPNEKELKFITDPRMQVRIYDAARKLWTEYLERRKSNRDRANEEYLAVLNLIDPLLVEDRQIAVKVLRSADAPGVKGDPALAEDLVRRFIKENDMLRSLRHPNIVRRFGLVRDSRLGWCMILEYIEGETLDEYQGRFPGRRIPLPTALRMTRELVAAVEYVQDHGIIHRDLKPQNIMIRADDSRVVLTDFGIGKWADHMNETRPLTMPGDRLGTPRYMAPEQVQDSAAVTRATDIYQLSTVLFEILTGRPAYESMDLPEIVTWITDRQRGHPTHLRDFLPELPVEIENLIEVGRDKDPDRRWTIREFREKLDRILAAGETAGEVRRLPTKAEDLERALFATRLRKKELQWEERLLEAALHRATLWSRLGEVRRLLGKGAHEEAKCLLGSIRVEIDILAPRLDPLRGELDSLDREIEMWAVRRELDAALSGAEAAFAARRFPDVGAALDNIHLRLKSLPEDVFGDLRERFRTLQEPFDARHRSFVDLYNVIRKSFVDKLRDRHREIRAAGAPPSSDVAREFLEQLAAAERNLTMMDPENVGTEACASLRAELRELRATFEGFAPSP